MALLEVNRVSFQYAQSEQEMVLRDVSFTVQPGQFIVLCGPSGCGKTTLLRHFKHELEPVGSRSGEVLYKGKLLSDHSSRTLAQEIGMVMQDPDNQIVMDNVLQELVFSLENLAYPASVMRKRVAEMSHFFGIEPWMHKKVEHLSGGQKQMINLASVLLLHPDVLLLDEPTAQLDPVAARDFLQMVYRLNQELGTTVILTEHRLEEVFSLADKLIMLDKGSIAYEGPPKKVAGTIWSFQDERFVEYIPAVSKLFLAFHQGGPAGQAEEIPLTVREGRIWLDGITETMGSIDSGSHHAHSLDSEDPQHQADLTESIELERHHNRSTDTEQPLTRSPDSASSESRLSHSNEYWAQRTSDDGSGGRQQPETILRCSGVFFQYEKAEPLVLKDLSLQLYRHDFLALLGGNGSGKSTLLQIMAGLLTPQRGKVLLEGEKLLSIKEEARYRKIGFLAQNPMLYFVYDTVEEELMQAANRVGLGDKEEAVGQMLRYFNLETLRRKHPYDCSGGERQKAALACILLAAPQVLLLDEPTKGLDPVSKVQLAACLRTLHETGCTIVIVTHDVEFAAKYAVRCAMLFDGCIASEGTPTSFFSGNYFYTTALNRMARNHAPQALIYEEVMKQWTARDSS